MLTIIADALMTASRQKRENPDERVMDQQAHHRMRRQARLESERAFRIDRHRNLW